MTGLYYEDFEMDREYETRARTITEADVVAFAGLSGDFNSIHIDQEFAGQSTFKGRIAHGMLGLSITSGLINQTGISEGTAIAFLGLTWGFKGAVKFGDTISVRLRVTDKRETSKPDRGIVKWAVFVSNQRGEIVQDGEFTMMMKRRGSAVEGSRAF